MSSFEKVLIDFSAGTCVASCDHCLFGTGKSGPTGVTSQQLDLYAQIQDYVEKRDTYLDVGLTDSIEVFGGDLGFITKADRVRLSVQDPMVYFEDTGKGVERVKTVLGSSLGNFNSLMVAWHAKSSPIRRLKVSTMVRVVDFQLLVSEACGVPADFWFRINRSHESVGQMVQDMKRAGRRYRKAFKYFAPEVKVSVRESSNQHFAALIAEASLGHARLGMGIRFMNTDYTNEDIVRGDEEVEKDSELFVLALFPNVVHANHTTLNINKKYLRFSYDEISQLIHEALASNVPAATLLSERIRERRKEANKVILLAKA